MKRFATYTKSDKMMLLLGSLAIFALIVVAWLNTYAWVPREIKYGEYAYYATVIIGGFLLWRSVLIFLLPIAPVVIPLGLYSAYDWGQDVVDGILGSERISDYALALLTTIMSILQVLIMATAIIIAYFWWKERCSASAYRYRIH